jgi:hypothetical protein
MRILKVVTEEQKAVARQLARGRVFATGKAFTPYTRAPIFTKLVELAREATNSVAIASSDAEKAAAKPSIGNLPTVSGTAAPADQANGTTGHRLAPPRAPAPPVNSRPLSWDDIEIGSLVLATTGVEDGWWESVVLGSNGEALTLKWRDFPGEPTFIRRRSELALLPVAKH